MSRLARETFDALLQEERETNARYLNALRPLGAASFLLVFWAQGWVHERGTGILAAYLVVACVLFVLARKFHGIARWSTLAIPFLDVPAVFFTQWLNINQKLGIEDVVVEAHNRAIAAFSLGLFLVLLMLSVFTLRTWRLAIVGLLAIGCEQALQSIAEDSAVGKWSSFATILIMLALCEYSIARRVALVHQVSDEHLRLERLHRYFSPEVAQTIERDEEELYSTGHLCEITVLFSDLRGFSAMSHCLTAPEVVRLLNEVHSLMVEVIFANGGTLDKYIGDGLMAYFGAPIAQPDHAVRALRCAEEMQVACAALSVTRTERGESPLRLSVGLHTGTAVVGAIGAANRLEFTVVGDTVNLAARMESLTRDYDADILVSAETTRELGDSHDLQLLGESHIKGYPQPVKVFTPAPKMLLNPGTIPRTAEESMAAPPAWLP